MSRAFIKEDSIGAEQELPPLPLSPHPNYVTPAGLAQLQQRLATVQAARDDDAPDAVAQRRREIAWLDARLAAAILVQPGSQPQDRVAFGASVEVADAAGRVQRYRIVGEDQADPAQGLVSWVSPLGKALIGARAGEVVIWPRPAGVLEIELLAIRYDD